MPDEPKPFDFGFPASPGDYWPAIMGDPGEESGEGGGAVSTGGTRGTVLTAYKKTDQPITNDSTLNPDADLHVPTIAGGVYAFHLFLHYNLAATGTGAFEFAMDAPSGAGGWTIGISLGTYTSQTSGGVTYHHEPIGIANPMTPITNPSNVLFGTYWGHGVLMNTSLGGDLSVAWDNTVVEAIALTLYAGSWLQLVKMG